MSRTLKILFILLFCTVALLVYPTLVNASDTLIATSTLNGISVSFEYKLNDAGQVTDLVCTNASALSGSVTVPGTLEGKTVVSLGNNAFKGAFNITSVVIPESIKEIKHSAFENCTKLTNVDLGSITSISFDVFKGCSSLTELTIPKTFKNGAVVPCLNNSSINKITFEDGLTVIPSYLCANTGITEINIPSSVQEIGNDAFSNCPNLKKITILDNVKKIGFYTISDTESIFKNHNTDLTIYCYQNSLAAAYAIKYNIKFEYLPQDSSNPSTDNDSNQNGGNSNSGDTTNKDNSNPKADPEEDSTTAPGKLPYTGSSIGIIVAIFFILGGGIFAYKKYNNLKGI